MLPCISPTNSYSMQYSFFTPPPYVCVSMCWACLCRYLSVRECSCMQTRGQPWLLFSETSFIVIEKETVSH